METTLRYFHHIFKAENPDIFKRRSRTILESYVEPRSCIETLKLAKGELVNCVHLAIRKHLGNVRGPTEIIVVDCNQDTVFGSLKVQFEIVDTHLTR